MNTLHLGQVVKKSDLAVVAVLCATMAILVGARSVHYLFFHTMAEVFAIVVSFSIFMLTWTSSRYLSNGYLVVIGAAYGAIGVVDVFHTLTFKGMNLFPGVSPNYPTQFWLTARYIEALALLCGPLVIGRKPNFFYVSIGFAAVATAACVAVMYQWFPATFIDGVGLTPFKVYSEYIIIAMLMVGFVLLYRSRRQFEPRIFFLLVCSLWLAIATEFCFTKYVGFYDFINELGHYFRFLSVALAFVAIVLSGVRQPLELIFHEMDVQKRELDAINLKLANSESFNISVFDSIIESIAVLNAQGVIIAVNGAWRRFALENGAPHLVNSSVGLNYLDICTRACAQADGAEAIATEAGIRAVLAGEKEEFRLEYPCHSPVVERWFNLRVTPLHGPRRGVVIAHENTTERKLSESVLRKERDFSQAIFDTAGTVIAVLDRKGHIVRLNKAGETLTGYRFEEVCEKPFWDIFLLESERDGVAAVFDCTTAGDIVARYENHWRCKDGSARLLDWHNTVLLNDKAEVEYIIGIANDITERKRSEEAISVSEKKFRTLFEEMVSGFALHQMVYDETGRPIDYITLEVNREFERLLNVAKESVIGKKAYETVPALDRKWLDIFSKVTLTGIPESYEEYASNLGKWFSGTVFSPQNGLVAGTFIDITDHKAAEREMRIAATAFNSHEGMTVTDADGTILRVNDAFTQITGYPAEEVIGKNPRLLQSGRHDANFYAAMWESIHSTGKWEGEIWNRRKSGEIYPERLSITAVRSANGVITNYVGTFIDITLSMAAEEEIKNLAFYDPLTRLPNRRLLMDRLQQALTSSKRSGRECALFFLDLDHFKTLNDTLGHDMGDLLLQQVAQRLESCVREGDTVARLGGDEFVVMLEELSELPVDAAAQTEIVGNKILDVLNQRYQLSTHEYRSSPSIGVTLFKGNQSSIEELLKQADIAMYQAKSSGRNALRFFDPEMQAAIHARVDLEDELRKAIENHQFHLYYQIQVSSVQLDGSHRPLGAEALIRWNHPERGLVSPMQFIPLAEESGLIVPIGQWVLETACAQLKVWQEDARTRDLVLSVNISAKQFRHVGFVAQMQSLLQRHAINPALLKLELTESLLLDDIEETIATMNTLKEIGIQFSLDDFGTGYSSLQYLKRLPLYQLKIDQSFVRDIAIDSSDRAIVNTIIAMAKSMHLNVIARVNLSNAKN
ncbi:MAG: EAL domain-containing protein [Rhodoferax sp.]|nr:EAL domain-containing protein [Rhodoferax sp.]